MNHVDRADYEDPVNEVREMLIADGLLGGDSAVLTPLAGGVSCDVIKVASGDRTMVVKRALKKLRVKDDWFADPSRNRYEHRYMSTVGAILPGAVPKVIHTNDPRGYFCMEWLGEGWGNWKQQMLGGNADRAVAEEAGAILGRIHRATFGDPTLRAAFDNTPNFFDLRLEPYLLTAGRRHPEWESEFRDEAERIRTTRECLVHGDYSPKNILVREGRVVILDCEVAWFGDPSFDLAFLLSHLHLKALYHAPLDRGFFAMPGAAAAAYNRQREFSQTEREAFDRRTARLLLMLMLARVDGKSPVEYLSAQAGKQDFVRRFVRRRLPGGSLTLEAVARQWWEQCRKIPSP